MKLKNSVISISLAAFLVGCGSGGGSSLLDNSGSSTLLDNELIYNQVIASKTKEAIAPYIMSKFGGNTPTEQNLKDIDTAVNNAKSIHSGQKPAAVTAAVINKVMTLASSNPDGIKDITVTAQDIIDADVPSLSKLALTQSLLKNVDAHIEQQDAAGWLDAGDASISYITAKNGKVVGSSHYHNALTVIDVATQNAVFSPVSIITDHGHHTDSASGASENYLRDVALSSDANFVYANIPPKSASSTTADAETIGLYKVKIEADGSIATVETALEGNGTRISIDETNSKRLDKRVSQFAISSDDSKVLVLDSDNNLFVYDGDLETEISAIETDGFSAIAISNETVFVAEDENITKLSASTLTDSDTIVLGFEPSEIMLNPDATKLVAYKSGGTDIAIVNLADNSVNASEVVMDSDAAAISPDFTKLALVGSGEKRVVIVNLTVPGFSIQSSHKIENGSRDVAFLDNDSIAIISDSNALSVLNIATTTENLNLDAKISLAKKGLNRSTINGGGYLNAVIDDITLSPAYENVNIAWNSTLPVGNLNITDGDVTRPAEDSIDVTGTLTANFSASFRDVTEEDSKSFDINIRKTPLTLPVAKSIDTGRADYMATNEDGSFLVSPIQADFNGTTKYAMASYRVLEDGNLTIVTEPKLYETDEAMVGVGINGTNAIGVATKEESGRIFSVAIAGDGALADSVTTSVDISSGTPLKVEWTTDNTNGVVMIEKPDGDFVAEIYTVDAGGNIELTSTYEMGAGIAYANHGPMAINEDGSKVFQKNSERTMVYAISATNVVASAPFENTVARIWYAFGFVFVHDYEGNIYTMDENLNLLHTYSTGTGGRMYGGEGRVVDGENYYIIPMQQADESMNGIYQLQVLADGSLKEIAFSHLAAGADRMAVSGDGKRVFFSYNSGGRKMAVVTIP